MELDYAITLEPGDVPKLRCQLTLWNQQGSEVIRGNVLAIPVDDSLLYVEPIYLRAETAAYPELRLVAVMQGDSLSYAATLEEALPGLFGEAVAPVSALTTVPGDASLEELAAAAQEAFQAYLTALGAQRFEDAAAALGRLRDLLAEMNAQDADGI